MSQDDAAFNILPADPSHCDTVLTLVCEEFCANSPLHQALDITPEEYRQIIAGNWKRYLLASPIASLIATSHVDGAVVGCIIPARFPSVFDPLESVPEKQRPVVALLSALEHQYLQKTQPENALLVDIAVVSTQASNRGLYQQMRLALHRNAVKAGFKYVLGELSSGTTQRVCVEKFKHSVMAEIRYDEFTYGNSKPFASITSAQSIQLVEGDLATE